MKKLTVFSAAILLCLLFVSASFIKKNSGNSSNSNQVILPSLTISPPAPYSKPFFIGVMANGNLDPYYNNAAELGFNIWHCYVKSFPQSLGGYGWPGISNDYVVADVSTYSSAVTTRINNNFSNNMYTFSNRPKFEHLAWGQRSDYQCESESYLDPHLSEYYPFYTYASSETGVNYTDGNVRGKYCTPNGHSTDGGQTFQDMSAGYVVKDLKTNREQINNVVWSFVYEIDDSRYPWYIKPRIKIDPIFAANPANNNKSVCQIEVLDFNGDIIKTVDIKVINFKDNGIYNGGYIEEYFNLSPDLIIPNGADFNPDNKLVWDVSCQVDFRVYWPGECEMWIDYVRLDNEKAHNLLSTDPTNTFHQRYIEWIEQEVDIAMQNPGRVHNFYIEEFEFNMLPCTKYLNEKIVQRSGGTLSLTNNLNRGMFEMHLPQGTTDNVGLSPSLFNPELAQFDEEKLKYYLIDYTGQKDIMPSFYPFEVLSNQMQYLPNTLPIGNESSPNFTNGLCATITTPDAYDNHLNDRIDWRIEYDLKLSDKISKEADISLYTLTQGHLWYDTLNNSILKEPTNEELEMLGNVPICYGAKGLQYFWYDGFYANSLYYGAGLLNWNGTKRIWNRYGQPKWNKMIELAEKYKTWGPYIASFENESRKTCIYRNGDERGDFLNNTYFSDIITYKPVIFEPPSSRYIQTTVFKNSEPNTQYFMIANRRCSPYVQSVDEGGRRRMHIVFDENSQSFANFNNWKIIDLEDNSTVITFDKNNSDTLELGWLMPGQGKLYKIAPVMQEGGTFVTHEQFGNLNFVCKDVVNNGGYSLDIGQGTTINFESDAKIVMQGGEFTSGYSFIGNPQTATVTYQGNGGVYWEGLEFNECDLVKINKAHITKLKQRPNQSTYTLTAADCPKVIIYNSLFEIESAHNDCGAISLNFVSEIPEEDEPSIDITGNIFDINSTGIPVVQISGYSASQVPVYVRWNNFSGNGSSNALMLSNVTGGVISNNTFNDFENAINCVTTYIDLYSNFINNNTSTNTNQGLKIEAGGYVNLSSIFSNVYNGGFNTFINYGSGSNNILSDYSYFTAKEGYNIFDVETISDAHFAGTFDITYNLERYEYATYNCFRSNGSENPLYSTLTWTYNLFPPALGEPVQFEINPTQCEIPSLNDYDVIAVTEYINDTLWYDSEGMGGGMSNKSSKKKLTVINEFENKKDSLNLFLRKRQMQDVKRIGNELTNTFSDSDRVIDIIQPLYYSTMITDNENNTGISALKTKLEDLIANNSENDALVMRCNYFIQKCKVILGDYSSAMSGFYDIMQAYPYSWEGVVAGWDYSATQLISQNGQGGGLNVRGERLEVKSEILDAKQAEISDESAGEFADEPYGDDPKGVKKTIEKTLTDKKEDAVKQIKVEEQQIKELKTNVKNVKTIEQNKAIQKKLQQKKVMSEIIQPRKPETVIEHISFVNADIQKIYSVSNKSTGVEESNSIPERYSLSQNYPNPFNPVTKIKFELPNESKVTIVIYDILGRKVAQLINNELRQAGRYEVQFNGHNFASGIYFYRLVANEFIDTKRMVLIK